MRLIDADDLKEKEFLTYQNNGVEIEEIMVVPVGAIDNAPTVEPKQGEFKCTECYRTFSKFSNESFNYCPHCGREVERR